MLSTFAHVVNRHTHRPGCRKNCRLRHEHVRGCPPGCSQPDRKTRIKLPCEQCGNVRVLGLDGTCELCWYAAFASAEGITGEDWLPRVRALVAPRPNSRHAPHTTPPATSTSLIVTAQVHPEDVFRIPGMRHIVWSERHKEGGPPLHGGPPNELATPTTRPTNPPRD